MPCGKILRLVLLAPAMAHWSLDDWKTSEDSTSTDTGLGVHVIDIPTARLAVGQTICFTFYWREADRWEGGDFTVGVE